VSNKTECVFAAVLAGGAVMLAMATPALTGGQGDQLPYYARSSFFPFVALGLIAGFGGWTAWQAWRGTARDLSDEIEATDTSVSRALGGAALFGLYILLCIIAGYAAATFLSIVMLGKWAGLRTRFTLSLALVTTAVLYSIFVLGFKVWFQPSWLGGWLA